MDFDGWKSFDSSDGRRWRTEDLWERILASCKIFPMKAMSAQVKLHIIFSFNVPSLCHVQLLSLCHAESSVIVLVVK